MWDMLNRDEHLVLAAISMQLYKNPLQPVSMTSIETWLAETDYPLDSVAINTALRSLEYYELIQGTIAQGYIPFPNYWKNGC